MIRSPSSPPTGPQTSAPAGPLVLLDLDDTLFTTPRKDPGAIHPAAKDRQGAPLSFQTPAQQAFWTWLQAAAGLVIPVTGRNVAALQRVTLPLPGQWAICSFGGTILRDGEPWRPWMADIADQSATVYGILGDLLTMVLDHARTTPVDVRASIVADLDIPLYLSIKHNQSDHEALAAVSHWFAPQVPPDWSVHLNANNLAVMPPFLGKAKAVTAVLQALDDVPPFILGAGDSLTDLGYMRLSDFALVPRSSQILATLPDVPGA